MTIERGTRILGFEIEEPIGSGGMATVYRAYQPALERHVALKVLAPQLAGSQEYRERFRREGVNLARLDHPAIVPVYEAGGDGTHLCLAMKLVEGTSLKELLARRGPLPPEQALEILERVGQGLDYAHDRGFVHRDVKPGNILIDADGLAYLSDFGLTKGSRDTSLTASGQWFGTVLYVAPEQARGETVDRRADLYSFACVAFECLTGTPPYTGDDPVGIVLAHAEDAPPSASDRNPALPRAVGPVLRRGIAKAATDRYPSAGDLLTQLRLALSGSATSETIKVQSVNGRDADGKPGRRGGWPKLLPAGTAATLAVLTVLLAVLLTVHLRPPSPPPLPPSPSPAASPTLPVTAGQLLYQAALDGTGTSFQDAVGRANDPAAEAVVFTPGALVLDARQTGADAGTDLRAGVSTYIAELEVSASPGSRVQFDVGLRWAIPGKLAYLLRMDTVSQTMMIDVFRDGSIIPLTSPIPVTGLQSSRVHNIVVSVEATRITLFLDGHRVAAVTDTQVPPAVTTPSLDVYGMPGTGTIRISKLRIYALS